MQISVISGKGGTGKTSFSAAFACLEPSLVLADCDVDAADLHLLVGSGWEGDIATEPFTSGYKARVDPALCAGCGRCLEVCRFNAVRISSTGEPGDGEKYRILELSCEGCGCCHDECPAGAVSLDENRAGDLFVSTSRFGTMVHATLGPGEGNSGKLVTRVRERAKEIAGSTGAKLVLIDGSPGIGCPVIASITGTDAVLIVTEPTVSGLHDLERVADLCAHFAIPTCAVVNKWDINPAMTDRVTETCEKRGIGVLGTVPFDPVFVEALTEGVTVVEYGEDGISGALRRIWSRLRDKVVGEVAP